MPFGPEISWPHGFRPLDSESRDVLESAYGTGPVYSQPAMDDYGYGDPGYADPSYEGPRTPYGGSAHGGPSGRPASGGQNGGSRNAAAPPASGGSGYRSPEVGVPGYQVPEIRDSGRSGYASPGYQPQGFAPPSGGREIWPVTGAQEALPDTGPQPIAPPIAPSAAESAADARGARGSGGFPQAGSPAYPDQWHDNPRPADPRLEGMNYGELRYDDPDPMDPVAPMDPIAPGEPGYDEPTDDGSWYEELRRSAPAYPQGFGSQHPSGPHRRVEPQAPAHGQMPAFPLAPDRAAGYGQTRGDWGSSSPQAPHGPQMNAGRMTGPAQPSSGRPSSGQPSSGQRSPGQPSSGQPSSGQPSSGQPSSGRRSGSQPGSPVPPGPAAQGTGFLSAPVASVGLLTPPAGTQVLTAPSASRPATAPVRPGHGLDGPEITSSWPVQPQTDDLESYEDFWRDDEDEEYTGLFGDRHAEFDRADARQAAAIRQVAAKRRIGRRRGRSNDHRLWLGLGGVVIVAAAAIVGIIKFEFPSHGSGPAHTMATPAEIGTYARTVDLERQVGLSQLRNEVIKMSSGQASGVVSAVYESGNSAAGNTAQIIMLIEGHLANADPAASIAGFTQKFPGAQVVSAGPMGGKAACVQEGTTASTSRSLCVWFDNDSFGEIVSPTMNATALASEMRTARPSVELVAKK